MSIHRNCVRRHLGGAELAPIGLLSAFVTVKVDVGCSFIAAMVS